MNKEYRAMVKHCLLELISRWNAMEKYDLMEKALSYAVHISGGFTIAKKFRSCEDYWFFEYAQNYKFGLWKYFGEDQEVVIEKIDKEFAKKLLKEIWLEYNRKGTQLQINF